MQVFDTRKKKSHADFLTQCLILTRRSFVNMHREVGYYWLRLLIYGALVQVFEREKINGHYGVIAFTIGNIIYYSILAIDVIVPRTSGLLPTILEKYPLHYISFHKYAYQGLFKNEFQGLTFAISNQVTSGDDILRHLWQMETSYSKIMFLIIIKCFEKVKPIVAGINSPQEIFRFTKVTRSSEI
ncbi:hypothetical protein MtrunA17_Chr4g0050241 [Medicago truncatula]|uniref:Uncharacterized protein n=1 Tax=Medicago truncatula TaxID=3880 RepID=A0A396IAS0_MEDTR|nr:hypothetical protein MtrunA17_Chr4g0050241 [Medicago truncatula]